MKNKLITKLVTVFVVMALAVGMFPGPAYAAGSLPKNNGGTAIPENKIPPLPNRVAVENFAARASKLLVLGKDGKFSLGSGQITTFSQEQNRLLNRFVNDINAGKIGIAIRTEHGTQVYGNSLAATQESDISTENSAWRDSWGLHIYLDSWWTGQLIDLNGWVIGTIAAAIVTVLCSNGWGCFLVGVLVSFVWYVIWQVLRPYAPTSVTFNLRYPYWSGGHLKFERYIQLWRNRAWYNGRSFYLGTMTL